MRIVRVVALTLLGACAGAAEVEPRDEPEAVDAGTFVDAGADDAGVSIDGGVVVSTLGDAYRTFVGSPIQVEAPGVLENDPGAVTATLQLGVQHGALSLGADGHFRYVPLSGFTGVDSFTYVAHNGAHRSEPATVTLTVRASVVEPTLVMLSSYAQSTALRPTPAELRTRMARVSELFAEYSYNALVLKGIKDASAAADVVGWYESTSSACVDLAGLMAAADSEVDFTRYTRVVLVVDPKPGCTLSAMGTLDRQFYNTPDGQAFFGLVQLSVVNAHPATLAHELGHTLRNGHGRFRNCGAVPWADSGCTSVEYGDPYDFMSLGTAHASARRKELMGWFNPSSNRLIEVTASGDYDLEPIETNTGGVKALKLARGDGFPLYLEYRQPLGADAALGANANAFTGLLVHAGGELLDMTPPAGTYGPGPPTDAQLTPVLPVSATWVDPVTGNRIEVLSRSPSGLRVRVSVR